MRGLIGEDAFKRGLQGFIRDWAYKHPTPWDFFYTFDNVAKRDLDWFWNDWFFGSGYIDLAVRGVKRADDGYAVSLENIGGMDAPVDLVLHYQDGTSQSVHETPAIWAADPRNTTVTVHATGPLQSVTLDGGIWVDADPSNNTWTAG